MENHEHRLEDHLGLAEVIALEYTNIPRTDTKEAISEAYIALNRAIKAYNPKKGDFTPFAAKVIRNALNTLYAKQLRMAKIFPKSIDSAPDWKSNSGAASSNSSDFVRRIKDSTQDVRKNVRLRESSSKVDEVMNLLSPRERRVIEGIRLGFSLAEIGERMGISKQAVHKVSAPALLKLRAHLESNGFAGIDSHGLLKSATKY